MFVLSLIPSKKMKDADKIRKKNSARLGILYIDDEHHIGTAMMKAYRYKKIEILDSCCIPLVTF